MGKQAAQCFPAAEKNGKSKREGFSSAGFVFVSALALYGAGLGSKLTPGASSSRW